MDGGILGNKGRDRSVLEHEQKLPSMRVPSHSENASAREGGRDLINHWTYSCGRYNSPRQEKGRRRKSENTHKRANVFSPFSTSLRSTRRGMREIGHTHKKKCQNQLANKKGSVSVADPPPFFPTYSCIKKKKRMRVENDAQKPDMELATSEGDI